MRKFIIMVSSIALLTGCASSSPSTLYSLLSKSSEKIALANVEVIKNTTAIPLPSKVHGFSLERESFEITSRDSLIDFGDYKSNYKLFSFQMNKGDVFRIEVISFCDCLGFDKRILVPVAYVFNENGEKIDHRIVSAGATSGVAIVDVNIEAKAPLNGKYYLLVAANNSKPGRVVGGELLLPDGRPLITNKSNPYGKIMPSYELIK